VLLAILAGGLRDRGPETQGGLIPPQDFGRYGHTISSTSPTTARYRCRTGGPASGS
jgi:hypothetical protein